MRLFIAVNFSQEVKAEIDTIKENLKKCSKQGKFTLKDNFHITLLFLGEQPNCKAAIEKLNTKGQIFLFETQV